MAVAFDVASSGHAGTSGAPSTTASWSHTGASGAALVVDACISKLDTDVSAYTVTVTYGGVSMTSSVRQAPGSNTSFVEKFVLLNACDGTAKTVLITVPTAAEIAGGSKSYTGAGSFGTGVGLAPGIAANSGTLNVTSSTNDMVDFCAAHGDLITNPGIGGTGTQRWLENWQQDTAGGCGVGGSYPGATTVATSALSGVSDHWTLVAVNVQAAAGTTTPDNVIVPRAPAPDRTGRRGQVPYSRIFRQTDSGPASEDHPTAGILSMMADGYAAAGHDSTTVGSLTAGVAPSSTVGHDSAIAGTLSAGAAPFAAAGKDTPAPGILSAGVAPMGSVGHDAALVGILSVAMAPSSLVGHGAVVAGILSVAAAGSVVPVSAADIATVGTLSVAAAPFAAVGKDSTITGTIQVAAAPASVVGKAAAVSGVLSMSLAPAGQAGHDSPTVGTLSVAIAPWATFTPAASIAATGVLSTAIGGSVTVAIPGVPAAFVQTGDLTLTAVDGSRFLLRVDGDRVLAVIEDGRTIEVIW
jgi:hypothetical protein